MERSELHVADSLKNLLAASFTTLSIIVFGVGGLMRDDVRRRARWIARRAPCETGC
ncbi:MAG: hypothetical protein AAF360_13465 [Pseudomonadota bacterium]